jgi:serine/threonine-protein kinase
VKEMIRYYTSPKEQEYAVKRFYEEAKILAKLRHPNLPRVIDHFTNKGKYYLVMDFIEGEDLETILKKENRNGIPEGNVIEYSTQILDVLAYLHNLNPPILYRDLKPANIMLQKNDGKAMLIDFGIARSVEPDAEVKKTAIGTEGYCSPEQYRGNPETRSDLYSLGATMHEILTGTEPLVPFQFTPVIELNPKISQKTNDIVMKSLKLRPEERFNSAEEMKNALLSPVQEIGLQKSATPVSSVYSRRDEILAAKRTGSNYSGAPSAKDKITVWATGTPLSRDKISVSAPYSVTPPSQEQRISAGAPYSVTPPSQEQRISVGATYSVTPPSQEQRISAGVPYSVTPASCKEVPEGMVLIPAGEFIYGYDYSDASCRPQDKYTLKAFYIDKYPVTNVMYRRFIKETNRKVPYMEGSETEIYNWSQTTKNYPPGKANHPVVMVSWFEAMEYAKWAKKRLPTELEWEKAARGTDGRLYPWGDKWENGKANCNVGGPGSTSPKDEFMGDRSPYGVMDMAGNIKEWTDDFYYPYPYKGEKKGKMKVIRGGSWSEHPNFSFTYLRNRNLPHYKANNMGFRCALDIDVSLI